MIPSDSQGRMLFMCLMGGVFFVAIGQVVGMPIVALLGVLVATIPGIMLYMVIKRNGMMMFLEPQRRGDVIVLYHAASGAVVPFKGKQLLERYLSLVGGYGRIRYPKRASYWLFGKRVVYAVQGCSHAVPLWAAWFTNVLKEKGYKSFGEAIVGEYGQDLRGLSGYSRDMALKVFDKEKIPLLKVEKNAQPEQEIPAPKRQKFPREENNNEDEKTHQ